MGVALAVMVGGHEQPLSREPLVRYDLIFTLIFTLFFTLIHFEEQKTDPGTPPKETHSSSADEFQLVDEDDSPGTAESPIPEATERFGGGAWRICDTFSSLEMPFFRG